MYFLLDTNIFIPLEPTGEDALPGNTFQALEFSRLAQQAIVLNTHPAMLQDISRDENPTRRDLRLTLFQRYSPISNPPSATILDPAIVSPAPIDSHDYVDNCLLAAVCRRNACDVLITEDRNIHRKALRLGVGDRVLLLSEAIDYIRSLFSYSPKSLPSVRLVFLHELNVSDPIFDSLKADYSGFDVWLEKGQRERREAYIIHAEDQQTIAGIAILKSEANIFTSYPAKHLKPVLSKLVMHITGDGMANYSLDLYTITPRPMTSYACISRLIPSKKGCEHLPSLLGFMTHKPEMRMAR